MKALKELFWLLFGKDEVKSRNAEAIKYVEGWHLVGPDENKIAMEPFPLIHGHFLVKNPQNSWLHLYGLKYIIPLYDSKSGESLHATFDWPGFTPMEDRQQLLINIAKFVYDYNLLNINTNKIYGNFSEGNSLDVMTLSEIKFYWLENQLKTYYKDIKNIEYVLPKEMWMYAGRKCIND